MQVKSNAAKWATRSAAASGEYAEGVQSPRRSWQQATEASEANYEAGLAAASAEKRFSKGVTAAGDAKYKQGVAEKGRTRFQQGVAVSQDAYSRGFAPFKSALESTTLAPRGPKGTNYGRVQQVGEALRTARRA